MCSHFGRIGTVVEVSCEWINSWKQRESRTSDENKAESIIKCKLVGKRLLITALTSKIATVVCKFIKDTGVYKWNK
jgi:hypothetical protein